MCLSDCLTVSHTYSYRAPTVYRLLQDPYELRNLVDAPTHALVREVMRERLVRRMVEAGEAEPTIVLVGDAYNGKAVGSQGMRDEEAYM